MNEAKKELVSAFMDDEIDSLQNNQVEQILNDPELMGAWSRYHLISDCLKRHLPEHQDRKLAGRVSRSTAQEPSIVAPGRLSHSLIKPAAGFAIAASVAALAILGIQQQQLGSSYVLPQDAPSQAAPGPNINGSVYAPALKVSAGGGKRMAECENRPVENARSEADSRQQRVENKAPDAQSRINCP